MLLNEGFVVLGCIFLDIMFVCCVCKETGYKLKVIISMKISKVLNHGVIDEPSPSPWVVIPNCEIDLEKVKSLASDDDDWCISWIVECVMTRHSKPWDLGSEGGRKGERDPWFIATNRGPIDESWDKSWDASQASFLVWFEAKKKLCLYKRLMEFLVYTLLNVLNIVAYVGVKKDTFDHCSWISDIIAISLELFDG